MFWLIYGFLVGVGIPIYIYPLIEILKIGGYEMSGLYPISYSLGVLSLILGITISTFVSDIFDSGIVITKTVTYSALGLFLIFLFAILEETVINFLSGYFNISDRYYSLFLIGFLAIGGNILSKAIEPSFGRFLNFINSKI